MDNVEWKMRSREVLENCCKFRRKSYLSESHCMCCDCLNLGDQVMLFEPECKSFILATGRLEEQGSLAGAVVEGSRERARSS